MFYLCDSLEYINLTNFNSNITSSSGMFNFCNPNLIYCIDDNKEYQILSELKNYKKSCSDMCTKYYLKKYIKEDNSCIDSCSTEIIYKYDFNNTCLENCPNNTILANDNVSCILIEDNEKNTTNNTSDDNTSNDDIKDNNNDNNNNKDTTNNGNGKKNLIIIISIISCVFILTGIIFFIKMCRNRAKKDKNNESLLQIELQNINTIDDEEVLDEPEERLGDDFVKIIFNFNQERTEIFELRQTSLKNLIISYTKTKQFENRKMIFFIFDGKKISYDEAINDDRKLSDFIPEDLKEKEILVYDWTIFISQCSQN
jgi:flagellar basal body-associated protein FliL